MEQLTTFYHYLLSVSPIWYIIIVLLIMFAENIFSPVPGDTILVFSVYVFTIRQDSLLLLFLLAFIFSMAGFFLMFAFGRKWGKRYLLEKNFYCFPARYIQKIELKFEKYGIALLVFSRFLPGFRAIIALFSGFSNYSKSIVFLLVSLSTLLWNGLLTGVGIYLGENWQTIEKLLKNYSQAIAIFFALIFISWAYRRIRDFKQLKKGDTA
ncbi:MAG TPA: DedA family protein [Candidatus Marinimicrobia bacterium]|nr:DedA family protein [Candidatus Neomarinimicrobiota bacterium]